MHLFDMLVMAHCAWAVLALINWGGVAQGIESGGIYVVEFAGAYLLGRLYIRSYEDFAAVARAYVGLVLATLVFTIPEALTGIHILHDGISGAVGGPMAPYHRTAHGAGADLRTLRPPDPLRRLLRLGLFARLFRRRGAAADEPPAWRKSSASASRPSCRPRAGPMSS
jgi:hypothetical protein